MKVDVPRAEIDIARIPADGNIGGMLFAVGSTAIFLIGIPEIRYIFPAAIVLGCGIALVLHFIRHETTGASWILSAPKK
jgi:hypothetical protein